MKTLFAAFTLEAVVLFAAVLWAMSDAVSSYWIGAIGFVIVGVVGHVLTYMKVQRNDEKTDKVGVKLEKVATQVDGKMSEMLNEISDLKQTIANMKQTAAVKHAGQAGAELGLAAGRAEGGMTDPPEPLH